ncbi:hypothetical protein N7495_007129 [Penicillium taxi]|uniref:uncharacterized protein n=1 Tax=Penicillium taxi TaxID=168475 RepID=UPI002545B046|nr:uncharacterized protein N7495_007129 [Penicillium taxi]KAJ5895438.1 hypothetical protein N7495_007129 [Penicillium taxi]
MWFTLAVIVGIGYLGIGWAGTWLGEFESIISQPIGFFDLTANSSGGLLSRLSTNPDAIKSLVGINIAVLMTVGVALLSVIVLALATGWKLGLVVIFGGSPFIFSAGIVHEKMDNNLEKVAQTMFTDSVSFAAECIQAIRTVSSLNMEPVVEAQFGRLLNDHCQQAIRYSVRTMVWFALSDAIDMLCMALAFWYRGRLPSFQEYTTTQFFIVFISIVFGSQSMGQFFAHSSDISKGINSARAISDMRRQVPQTKATQKVLFPGNWDATNPLIEFRDVSFGYATRPDHMILKNFNMSIYMLVNLLQSATSGETRIGGIPIQDLVPAEVTNLISLVSQEPVLYQGTIEENINLGIPTALSQSELENVISQAQLSDMVSSLPDGAKTYVGSGGTAVSGGQKQRIAIARAIAQNTPILLLDEATSALDGEIVRAL